MTLRLAFYLNNVYVKLKTPSVILYFAKLTFITEKN